MDDNLTHITPGPDPGGSADAGRPFVYRGRHFVCKVIATSSGLFQPVVVMSLPGSDGTKEELPGDADPYACAAEAARHAEQQAIRWVHVRTGDGRGQI